MIEFDLVVGDVPSTDPARLTVAPRDLEHDVSRDGPACSAVLVRLGKGLRLKEDRTDVAEHTATEFLAAEALDPRPPARTETENRFDSPEDLRLGLQFTAPRRIEPLLVVLPDNPDRQLRPWQREELNQRPVRAVL